LRSRYKYVVIDLPPVGARIDTLAASTSIDGCLLVLEWSRTSRAAVEEALRGAELLREKLIGAVLNKVDIRTLRRLEPHAAELYPD
jgi:succinoglycan biosynthesis transport protein ExoP